MPSYGVTALGFIPPSESEIQAIIEAALQAAYGPNTQVAPRSNFGQLTGIFARLFADTWKTGEDIYSTGYLAGAYGQTLDDLLALAGISRAPAVATTVTLSLTGSPGTVVPAGTILESTASGTQVSIDSEVTFVGGTVDAATTAVRTGPVLITTGTSFDRVVTPVAGLVSGVAAADGIIGADRQTDAAAKLEFIRRFSSGQSSPAGLETRLLKALENASPAVTSVSVFDNRTPFTSFDAIPPYALETVIVGGTEAAIFEALLAVMPAGHELHGTTTGTVADSNGQLQPVAFSRPVDVPIYIQVNWALAKDAPADVQTLVRNEIVTRAQSLLAKPGTDIYPFQLEQGIETTGIQQLQLLVGTANPATSGDPIIATRRQRLQVDSSRIAFGDL